MGVISHGRATAKGAIELALELLGKGFDSVRIVSPDGTVWESPQFANCSSRTRGGQIPTGPKGENSNCTLVLPIRTPHARKCMIALEDGANCTLARRIESVKSP